MVNMRRFFKKDETCLNYIVCILDSLRYDIAKETETEFLDKASLRRALSPSYFSPTALYCITRGWFPLSTYRLQDMIPDLDFSQENTLKPFPFKLKGNFRCNLLSANPQVDLHRKTLTEGFNNVKLYSKNHIPKKSWFSANRIVADIISLAKDRYFTMAIFLETHYPYYNSGLDIDTIKREVKEGAFQFDICRKAQSNSLKYLDEQLSVLQKLKNVRLIVTSDHGELMGENGSFGHFPREIGSLMKVPSIKLFEVPLWVIDL